MIEITVTLRHELPPELLQWLRGAPAPVPVAAPVPPAEPVPDRKAADDKAFEREMGGAPAKKRAGRPPRAPEAGPTPPPEPSGLPTELPDYEKIRSAIRAQIQEGMTRDLNNKNKEYRTKIGDLWTQIVPESGGKLSGVPDESLEEALAAINALLAG